MIIKDKNINARFCNQQAGKITRTLPEVFVCTLTQTTLLLIKTQMNKLS
jgi:hypothetical protein